MIQPQVSQSRNPDEDDQSRTGQANTSGPQETTLYPNQEQSQAQNRLTTQRKHK